MNEERLQILISAKDNATKSIQKTGNSFNNLKSRVGSAMKSIGIAVAAGGAAFYAIGRVVGSLIEEYGTQERANARLAAAMKNVKGQTDKNIDRLTGLADAYQKVTTFADEQIVSGQAMLSTFQLTGDQIATMTPRMLDMAAALEKTTGEEANLEDVAKAMGKAMTGTSGALKRYGVSLTKAQQEQYNATSGAERLKLLMKILDQNFKGVAKSAGETLTGQMKILSNAFGELKEAAGEKLAKALAPLVKDFKKWAQSSETQEKIKAITSSLVTLGTTLGDMVKSLFGFNKQTGQANSILDKINFAIILLDECLKNLKKGIIITGKAIATVGIAIYNIFIRPIQEGFINISTRVQTLHLQLRRLAGTNKAFQALYYILYLMKQTILAMLNPLKTILKLIGKISKYRGGSSLFGIVGGLGGLLKGLQHGGIVTQPTLAMIGEAGPEAVVPLNRVGAVGGITINVTGNTFIDAEDMADKIDRVLMDKLRKRMRVLPYY